MTQGDDEGLWVRSEVMLDGSYGVTITVEADTAFTLNREAATAYAVAGVAVATEAEHDTAALRLLVEKVGVPPNLARQFLLDDIYPDRPSHDHMTAPVRFTPPGSAKKRAGRQAILTDAVPSRAR